MVEPEDERQVELAVLEGERALVRLAVGEERKVSNARAPKTALALVNEPKRKRPPRSPAIARNSASAAAMCVSTASAWSASATGFGQADAAAGPLEERRADVALEIRHLLGDC